MNDFDVVVCGAGPGGSAAAALLARAGSRVLVLDAARFPRDKACSEFMSPAVLPILARLGVLAELGGTRPEGTTVHAANGGTLTGRFGASGPPRGLALARRELDARIVAAAREAGAVVREGIRVRDLLYDRGAVAGVVADDAGRTHAVRARLVIGADGLRSVVARRLGRRRHGAPRRLAFVAHVAGVRGIGTTAELHVGRTGYVGLNPIGDDVTNVALVVPRATAAEARGDARGFFYRTIERFPSVAGRVDQRRETRMVLATGPFAARSSRVIAPGALLLGDAAEFFDPFTGEGIYRALRGAELAAEAAIPALATGRRVREDDLLPYLAARRRAFAGGQAVERIIGWLMLAPWLFDRAVRRLSRHGLADRLIGVTGDLRPAADALNPAFLLRALL